MKSSATTSPYQLFVGVDIAAASFAASWTQAGPPTERARTFSQTPDGFAAFQAALASCGVESARTLIVLEATGSYWITLAVTLHQAGYAVSVVNPAQVHNFLRSLPRRAKTDALDAQVLTQFALERQGPIWTPPPQVYHELYQRLLARDGLIAMRQHARNQRHALQQWPVVIPTVLEQLDGVIAELSERIARLEQEIASTLRDGAWAESSRLLQSITGIGLITTGWLLVATLNFSIAATPEQAAAYAGLVPLVRESGTSVRGRGHIGHGGHARLRTALYMATLSAAQHNPLIQHFYQRLRAGGKLKKVARCAAARKLLHIAWAVVRKGQPFVPTYERAAERLSA